MNENRKNHQSLKKPMKIAGALLPLMMLGAPAASGSSRSLNRSGSRSHGKKAYVLSDQKEESRAKPSANPFAAFGETAKPEAPSTTGNEKVMAFLSDEGLLEPGVEKKSRESGENRKEFSAIGTCRGGPHDGTWTCDTATTLSVTCDTVNGSSACTVGGGNSAPTDIGLDSTSIDDSATGAGAVIGNLSTTDADGGDSHTYALVTNGTSDNGSCGAAGDDDNANFQVDNANDDLETGGSVSPGTYKVCVETDDGSASYQESFTITVNDATDPTLSSTSPADGGTGFTVSSNLTATFDENIALGTGNIVLYDGSGAVETFDASNGTGDNAGTVSVSTTTLTINPGADLDYNTAYYVQIAATAIDDTSGNSYAGITDTTTWNFTSAEPTVTLSVNNDPIAENGGTSTVTATLAGAAGQDVTVTLAKSGTATDTDDYTLSSTSIVITAGNTTGTATITAVNDDIDDDAETVIIDISGVTNGTESGTQQESVTITDDDTAGITLSASTASVAETATTDTFTVVLDTKPTGDVVLAVASNDTGEVTVSPATLTFTSANWSSTQTVTVTGVDDSIDDGNVETNVSVSVNTGSTADSVYDLLAEQNVTVTTSDNDTAGYTLSKTTASVSETGTTDTFTVVLDTQPTSNVVFGVSSNDTGEATVSPATLTFTTGNWNSAQTVTITGVDDVAVDGSQTPTVTVSVTDGSSDDVFDPLADQTVTVTVTDDDNNAPAFGLASATLTLNEDNGSNQFNNLLGAGDADNNDVITWDISSGPSNGTLGGFTTLPTATSDGASTYYPTGLTYTADGNFTGTDTFDINISDGIDTDTITITVNVTNQNDAPVFNAGTTNTLTVDEDNGSNQINSLLSVTDPDSDGLTWSVTSAPSRGSLGGFNATGVSGTSVTPTGLTYTPTADANGTDAFTIQVADGNGSTDSITVNVTITNINDAPTAGNVAWDLMAYYEGNGSVIVEQSSDVNVTDVDSADFADGNLTVSIIEGGVESEDNLSIQSQGVGTGQIGVSGSNIAYEGTPFGVLDDSNKSSLVITFDNDANTTAVEALIQAILYENNNSTEPTEGNRTIRFTLYDGDGNSAYNSYDMNVSVTGVNDEPTLTSTASSPTFTEGGASAGLFTGTAIDTVESGQNITAMQLTVTNVNDSGEENLTIDGTDVNLSNGVTGTTAANSFGYSVTLSGSTATVGISKTDTAANWQTLVDNLAYGNMDDDPDATSRSVILTFIQDSGGTDNGGDDNATLSVSDTVSITPVNDAPILDLNGSGSTGYNYDTTYSIGGSAVSVADSDSVITDADDGHMASARITLGGVLDAGSESITIDGVTSGGTVNGVTVTYTSSTQVDLSGLATNSVYADIIESVKYANALSAGSATTGIRTVTIYVNDGNTSSNSPTTSISVVTAPVLDLDGNSGTSTYSASFTEAGGTVDIIDSTATLTDSDSANLSGFTVQITNAQTGDALILGSYGNGDSVGSINITQLTDTRIDLNGTDTVANYLALLKLLDFNNSTAQPDTGDRTVTFQGQDTDGYTGSTVSATVTITGINYAPDYNQTVADLNQTLTEDFNEYNLTVSGISDDDMDDLNITVDINDTSVATVNATWSGWLSFGDYNGSELNITITPVTNGYGLAEANITINDGNTTITREFNISVGAVNDAPVLSAIADLNLSEDFGEHNVTLSATDADGDALEYNATSSDTSIATVSVTGTTLTVTSVDDAYGVLTVDVNVTDGNASHGVRFDLNVTDATPAALSFTAVTDATKSTSYTSNSQTVTGIEANATITVTGGSYRLDGGAWTTAEGNVSADQTLELQLTSSTSNSTQTCATVTIGGDNSYSYCVTTEAAATGGSTGGSTGGTTTPPADTGGGFVPTDPEPEPEDPDVITVIDPEEGDEEPVIIDEVDTGETIEESSDVTTGEDGTQTVNVTLNGGGGTTLKFAPGSGPVTTTTTTEGYEATATLTTPSGNQVTTSAKVNNNGTLQAEVTVTQGTTTKKGKINSLKTGTNLTTTEDGGVEANYETDNVKVKAGTGDDGAIVHEVDVTDTQGNTVATKATSKVSGSSVTILTDGSVQTKAKVEPGDGTTVDAVVDGKADGKASHLLKVTDSQGNIVTTKATSERAGAQTVIEEDGGVETTVGDISVKAQPDGKAVHAVSVTKPGGARVRTEARSNIKGASTTIQSAGGVTTQVQTTTTNGNGEEVVIRAVVKTADDGTSVSRFEQVNLTTGESTNLDNTVSESTPLEEGNTVEISEEGGKIYMDAQTKVTKEMTFE